MRRVFKLSIAVVACALVAWLGFEVWSIYSFLPHGAGDAPRDPAERVPSGPATSELREAEPAALQARNVEPPTQFNSGAELQPPGDIGGCYDPNATVQWSVADPLFAPPTPTNSPPEMLKERAMAGDVVAQFWAGFHLQQQIVARIPTKDRSSISPQRFEYMQNFLILAAKNGSRSAARTLAEAYISTGRDVVETAAWLRIAGRRRDQPERVYLADYERQGLVVLSNEQRAESLRVAAELAQLYNLPLSVGAARVVTDGDISAPPSDDCFSSRSDPLSLMAADLDAYVADVKRNSFAPDIVSEEDLRRRFRDIRRRLVTSLRLGNGSAVPLLATLHRESPGGENAVAAAVWARIGSELYGIASDADAADATAADTTPALPPSAALPVLSERQIVDAELRAVVDNLRRRSISAGMLADQYLMLFDLD